MMMIHIYNDDKIILVLKPLEETLSISVTIIRLNFAYTMYKRHYFSNARKDYHIYTNIVVTAIVVEMVVVSNYQSCLCYITSQVILYLSFSNYMKYFNIVQRDKRHH